MAKAPATPRRTHEPQLWPVVDRHLDTLNAIADGLALVHSILGKDADPRIALHILAGEYPETRDLVRPVRLLAEILVESASNAPVDASRDAERSAAIESINAALKQAHFRATRRSRNDTLATRDGSLTKQDWSATTSSAFWRRTATTGMSSSWIECRRWLPTRG